MFKNLLNNRHQISDDPTHLRTILYIIAIASLMFIGAMSFVNFIIGYYEILFPLGVVFVINLILLIWIWQERLLLPRITFPLVTFGILNYIVSVHADTHDSVMLAYPIVIVMGGLLLGKWGALVLGVLTMLSISLIGMGEIQGWITNTYSQDTTVTQIVKYDFIIGFITLLLYVTIANLNRNLRLAHGNEQAIADSNQELEEIRDSLESQVTERTLGLEQARTEAESARQVMAAQMWQTSGQAILGDQMRGEQDTATLANHIVQQLCAYLDAQVGALFVRHENVLKLMGSYAYTHRKHDQNEFTIGQGLVGQAALEKHAIILTKVPPEYLVIRSGLGETAPRNIVVLPFLYENEVVGVVEIGTLNEFKAAQSKYLEDAMDNIAIAFHTNQTRNRIDTLLSRTQQQTEELQIQGEELRAANEELETQTGSLRASEARLREQQTELEATNTELEEKALALQQQQAVLDKQNQNLRVAQTELQEQADELARASRYKSEFLANMSHELRTPLNSLLILARMFASNEDGNLTEEQIESAGIIFNSGNDLLHLINEILDLSKVEAGKMDFIFAPMEIADLITLMRRQFSHIAEEKELTFITTLDDDVPDIIETDEKRVFQIVKNLLSNAFKFTTEGIVRLHIHRPTATGKDPQLSMPPSALTSAPALAISISDTGIGMTPDQQRIVFEAFQQADGSTSRKYGGTGLGLSISREFAQHLGGELTLESAPSEGSTFTLHLPLQGPQSPDKSATADPTSYPPPAATRRPRSNLDRQRPAPSSPPPAFRGPLPITTVSDDRESLTSDDRVLLIVEDNASFAKIVRNYAQRKGFKCLVAGDGKTALKLVDAYQPAAIILDLNLPVLDGWQVLEALKGNPTTRHIPVHIMSVADEDLNAYKKGAIGYLTKPVSPDNLEASFQRIETFMSSDIKSLLIIEDDPHLRIGIKKLLGGNDLAIVDAENGKTARQALNEHTFDCIILDLNLPDITGFDLLNRIHTHAAHTHCPLIIYTGRALTEEENHELMKYADSIIIKGIKAPERLLDETALFLHRVVADMPAEKQKTIRQLHGQETRFTGKHVLIVDDDMRNAYALSKVLGRKGLKVRLARSGQKAIEMLNTTSDIDLVLMDIMMPDMNGYETTRRIRQQPQLRNLPIFALTAKAMKGDYEKCITAGANDYLTKPVDLERLLSMLRVWLYH